MTVIDLCLFLTVEGLSAVCDHTHLLFVTIIVLWLFLTAPWVDLQCVSLCYFLIILTTRFLKGTRTSGVSYEVFLLRTVFCQFF